MKTARSTMATMAAILLFFALPACESDDADPVASDITGGQEVSFGNGSPPTDTASPEDTVEDDPDGQFYSDVPSDCEPNCEGLECGPDPVCGWSCGDCPGYDFCMEGVCHECIPNCERDFRNCGDDGCGGSCGECTDQYQECDEHIGRCVMGCIPNCAGRQCGPDGCGGSCGDCAPELTCNTANGNCQETCVPYCTNRECGTDGCGGFCPPGSDGTCEFPRNCYEFSGRCVDECVRQCEGRECGDDQCGGRCGYCALGYGCNEMVGECEPLPLTCSQVRLCIRACGTVDEECPDECRAISTGTSLTLFDNLQSCLATHCADEPWASLNICLAEHCRSALTACGLDFRCGDPGTQACMSAATCMGSCGDAACVNNCLCQADEPAYGQARAYAECIVQNCPAFDAECLQEAQMPMMGSCGMQWMSCMGGTPM